MIRLLISLVCLNATTLIYSENPPHLTQTTDWATETLSCLSLKEKIGQLFVVAAASDFNQPTESLATALFKCPYKIDSEYIQILVQKYHVGGIIFLFKSTPEKQMLLTQQLQALAKIPLLITQDSEWGLSMRLDAQPHNVVRYPRNMTLGAINDPQLIYAMGYEIGCQCAAIGVHINFAPVIDVNNNSANPVIADRSFGDNPEHVAQCGALFARGLQDAGIIACAKHFPGHGDTAIDSHHDLPIIDHTRQRIDELELMPFKHLIANGIGGIMLAHLSVPALDPSYKPSSLSSLIVTTELKENLGFKGLVFTDALGMQALTKQYQPGEIELEAFLAGNDILLCPVDVPKACMLIEKAINDGLVSEAELDARVLKILQAKTWVYNKIGSGNETELSQKSSFLTRRQAYELQERLYRSALTIAKGAEYLPVKLNNQCLIQIGELPDNSFQAAWSKAVSNLAIETVYTASAACTDHELQTCLEHCQEFDTAIICVGQMHKFVHTHYGIADNTRALVAQLAKQGKSVIVVLYGTPYSVSYFKDAAAIIVAYEDAQPAQQAAVDVLLGRLLATGHMPVTVSL